MGLLARHWPRIAITLAPLVFALLHAVGALPIGFIHRLDAILYDARLRLSFVQRLRDERPFPDVDALRAQIEADARAARRLFGRISL